MGAKVNAMPVPIGFRFKPFRAEYVAGGFEIEDGRLSCGERGVSGLVYRWAVSCRIWVLAVAPIVISCCVGVLLCCGSLICSFLLQASLPYITLLRLLRGLV